MTFISFVSEKFSKDLYSFEVLGDLTSVYLRPIDNIPLSDFFEHRSIRRHTEEMLTEFRLTIADFQD